MKQIQDRMPRRAARILLGVGVLFMGTLHAQITTLVDCPAGSIGDLTTRGFYVTNYPGTTINGVTVYMKTQSATPWQYQVSLTVREGTFDGPVIASWFANATLDNTEKVVSIQMVSPPPQQTNPPVTPGATLCFSFDINAQAGAPSTFFICEGLLGEDLPDDEDPCPNVVETEGTTPPLSTFRREGVKLQITGELNLDIGTGQTIQAAIDLASPGDTVSVAPGTYNEELTLRSEIDVIGSGPGQTILEPSAGTGVRAIDITNTEFSGFTIQPAPGSTATTGFYIRGGSPMVSNNHITGFPMYGIEVVNGSGALICGNRLEANSQSSGVTNPGIGSISVDPLYEPGAPGEYLLSESSPCIDAGDPNPLYDDLDGSRNDMGHSGGPCSVSAAPGTVRVGYLWTSVGTIPVSEIEQSSSSAKAGLTLDRDRPFGGKPWLYGPFGVTETGVKFYAVKIGPWSGATPPTDPGDYTYLDLPLSKVRYTVSGGTIIATNTAIGPFSTPGTPPLYTLTINSTAGYWAHENLRMVLNTLGLENGRYDLRMEGYDSGGNPVTLGGLTPTLTLFVNNTRPVVSIDAVSYGGGAPFGECSFVDLPSPTSTLDFVYTASHADGFLDNYALDLRPPPSCSPDLDGDGDVDAQDLSIMAESYGKAP